MTIIIWLNLFFIQLFLLKKKKKILTKLFEFDLHFFFITESFFKSQKIRVQLNKQISPSHYSIKSCIRVCVDRYIVLFVLCQKQILYKQTILDSRALIVVPQITGFLNVIIWTIYLGTYIQLYTTESPASLKNTAT